MRTSLSFSDRRSLFDPIAGERGWFTCPCCGYPTLPQLEIYDICPVCHWEDDGQDDSDAAEIWGGPNRDYSLSEARNNFEAHGTMYRKRDRQHFSRTTSGRELDRKRRLIAAYSELASTESGPLKDAVWNSIRRILS